LAAILSEYYHDREALNRNARWCYDMACSSKYEWGNIGKDMAGIIESLLQKEKEPAFKGFGAPAKVN
jgi:hypothetical protein